MKTSLDTIERRFEKRSLPDLLVRKFLTEYGYDRGPVIARAIVEDILATVEKCWPERVPPKTVTWLAVRREWRGRRKSLDVTDLIPIQLPVVTKSEIGLLVAPKLRKERKAQRAYNRARFARWQHEVLKPLPRASLEGEVVAVEMWPALRAAHNLTAITTTDRADSREKAPNRHHMARH